MTKFGEQPAKGIIRKRGTSVANVAVEIGVNHSHLNGALNGYVRPNEVVRERLPKLLGKRLDELFNPDVLAEEFGAGRGGRSGEGWTYLPGGWRMYTEMPPRPYVDEGEPWVLKHTLFTPSGRRLTTESHGLTSE